MVQLPEGADRDAVIAALAERGVEAKAYLPCIHLMRALPRALRATARAQFPVAERVSARSLALPFFTAMGEAEVERVTAALAVALGLRAPA